ncbi:2-dehydropantoate 2-reductase [Streptomyces palmae]|uniref:2-dehydropantoate 2-reductase n=1 Tax=Streptomyces palmae TaxID=1701085 RepID=A0A4Z0H709_9ACTN|nr:2-dehydropantoate 2-reductase [Streptomyces palmae]
MFGAGSIGCRLGGSLASVAEVTLIGRPAAMATLRENGLTLTGGGRPAVTVDPAALRLADTPEAVAQSIAGADFVLVTVKSMATEDAARQLLPHLAPGTVVVSFQNGLRNPEVIRSVLGDRPVVAGMVPFNVLPTAPGTYHQGSGGALMVDDQPAGAPLVAALSAAGLPVRAHADMRAVQHAKLLMNLNNAVNGLSGLPLREELGQRAFRLCLALCQSEALAAYRAEGVRPTRLGALPTHLMPRLLRLPDRLFQRLAASVLAIDAEARSSTWDDLRRGRPTEIDSLQGEIVAMAARHGLPAPACARLVELVREAESAGPERARHWTGPELLAELTAARG